MEYDPTLTAQELQNEELENYFDKCEKEEAKKAEEVQQALSAQEQHNLDNEDGPRQPTMNYQELMAAKATSINEVEAEEVQQED